MEEILRAPEDEEIGTLYSEINRDANFLRAFDRDHFIETPLHVAASKGRTQLALEIQRLMPSFGRKLNCNGFNPLDLALQRGHRDTVSAMVKLNPDLVRVQGREGITPLHYTAETNDTDLMAEFLLICPESIDDLTVRGESAVHVAVKYRNLAAFKVLYGWVERTGVRDVYGWRDWKGNTVLHLGASTNQHEVMKLLLMTQVRVNDKNKEGLTALDLVKLQPDQVNEKSLRILNHHRAKSGSSIHKTRIVTVANYLSSTTTTDMEGRMIKSGVFLESGLRGEMRNAVMVVAVLIVTATYQAVLSPPGGINNNANYGKAMMPKSDFLSFMTLNSIALATSLGIIFLLLPLRWYNFLLHVSMFFLLLSYMGAMNSISPLDKKARVIEWATYVVFFVLIGSKMFFIWLQWRVRYSWRLVGSNNFYDIHEVMTAVFRTKYSNYRFRNSSRHMRSG